MARCETCGNEYDKAFTITVAKQSHTFDSLECAIHRKRLLVTSITPCPG